MKKARITIINMEKATFKNEKKGIDREMTKITYALPVEKNDRFAGHAILSCYSVGEAFTALEKYIMVPVNAEIEERYTDNGSKYYLSLVNDVKLR